MKLYLVIIVLLLFIVASCCNNKHKNNHIVEKFTSEPSLMDSLIAAEKGFKEHLKNDIFNEFDFTNKALVIKYNDFADKICTNKNKLNSLDQLWIDIKDRSEFRRNTTEFKCKKIWKKFFKRESDRPEVTVDEIIKFGWHQATPAQERAKYEYEAFYLKKPQLVDVMNAAKKTFSSNLENNIFNEFDFSNKELVITYNDFSNKICSDKDKVGSLVSLLINVKDRSAFRKNTGKCKKLWKKFFKNESEDEENVTVKDIIKYGWANATPARKLAESTYDTKKANYIISKKNLAKYQKKITEYNHTNTKCGGPPACKKATKTLDEDGNQTFKRCKSGCGTKIPKLGYICCDKGCCNKKSVETDTVRTAVRKTTENINELSNIGQNLDTSNSVNASSVSSSSTQNTIENKKEISDLKKQIARQNKKIENLDAKVINSNDKYFASVKNRDSKLIEANDGIEPIDPASFSFKPEVKFNHKQPDPKIASSYGWSFMPPQFWSVPQKRPPSCVPSKQNTATVTPIYDKSVPVDVLDYTQVGSMLPKFKYKEIHNPDYYYPGYIAKKDEPYPGKNGRKVMKTGEYYNMKLARPTGLEPRKGIKFGKKIIDDNVVPHKAIRKKLDRTLPVAKPGKNKRARPGCGIIKGNPALSHHCNNAKIVPKSKCKSGCSTTIRGLGSVCCKTKCCTAQPKSATKK